ncbi:hypothetical protein AAC387_Pa06g1523 [Persea americana]
MCFSFSLSQTQPKANLQIPFRLLLPSSPPLFILPIILGDEAGNHQVIDFVRRPRPLLRLRKMIDQKLPQPQPLMRLSPRHLHLSPTTMKNGFASLLPGLESALPP